MPATIETAIWLAIKSRIDTLVTDPVMTVYGPGATFTAPSDATGPLPFILASDGRNDSDRGGRIDPTLHVRSGTLLLSVQWPIAREIDHVQLVQIGGTIAAHFPAGTRMRYSDTCLRTVKDADPLQPDRDGAYRSLTVRIPWATS